MLTRTHDEALAVCQKINAMLSQDMPADSYERLHELTKMRSQILDMVRPLAEWGKNCAQLESRLGIQHYKLIASRLAYSSAEHIASAKRCPQLQENCDSACRKNIEAAKHLGVEDHYNYVLSLLDNEEMAFA